ncbi:hypothetical protein D3C77_543570 [compost metagenome]
MVEFVKASNPPPRPPAPPAPGTSTISIPSSCFTISLKCLKFRSRICTISGVAPFCGPKTTDAPRSPHNGLVTSEATTIFIRFSSGSTSVTSMLARPSRYPPPSNSSSPCLFRNLYPSAAAMPVPASFVALPPMPRIISVMPLSIQSLINSPVP